MLMTNDLTNIRNLVERESMTEHDDFVNKPENKLAREDFKYLCAQSNFGVRLSEYYIQLDKTNPVGEFLVLGLADGETEVTFPKEVLKLDRENMYVAVVTYKGKDVSEVYVFKASEFTGKTGMMSIFKDHKKTNEFGIIMNKPAKIDQNKFATVLKDYLN